MIICISMYVDEMRVAAWNTYERYFELREIVIRTSKVF